MAAKLCCSAPSVLADFGAGWTKTKELLPCWGWFQGLGLPNLPENATCTTSPTQRRERVGTDLGVHAVEDHLLRLSVGLDEAVQVGGELVVRAVDAAGDVPPLRVGGRCRDGAACTGQPRDVATLFLLRFPFHPGAALLPWCHPGLWKAPTRTGCRGFQSALPPAQQKIQNGGAGEQKKTAIPQQQIPPAKKQPTSTAHARPSRPHVVPGSPPPAHRSPPGPSPPSASPPDSPRAGGAGPRAPRGTARGGSSWQLAEQRRRMGWRGNWFGPGRRGQHTHRFAGLGVSPLLTVVSGFLGFLGFMNYELRWDGPTCQLARAGGSHQGVCHFLKKMPQKTGKKCRP